LGGAHELDGRPMMDGVNHVLAQARTQDLLVEQVGSEMVIYDVREKQAHCLSPLAAAVFELSNGSRSSSELAAAASARLDEPVDQSDVEQALGELRHLDLLVDEPGDGVSRRQMLRRTAAVGGSVAAAALITTLPPAAMAQGTGTCAGACVSGPTGQAQCQARGGASCTCVNLGGNNRVCQL